MHGATLEISGGRAAIDLINAGTPSGLRALFSVFPFLCLRIDFITILLVNLVREQLQWPKLNFGEVVYRLSPGYYPFGDYCASMFCAWFVMKVYFLAEICM